MRKWLIALLVGVLVTAMAPVALADDDDGDDDEGGTYLALGDSVAAGTQQPLPFTPNGYTNELFDHLEDEYEFDNFVNLACPGEDTVEMRFGIGSACYGSGGTSQLDVAVAYLTANPGEVKLISIVMGANDILGCSPADPPCFFGQLGQIGANLPVIIGTLQTVAPGVPIVAMNYYNPNLAFWVTGPAGPALATQSLAIISVFNGTLEGIYDAAGVPVADVETAFGTFKTGGGDPPRNVRLVCKLTLMCEKSGGVFVLSPQPDIHPSNRGYRRIAATHADLLDDLDILDDD